MARVERVSLPFYFPDRRTLAVSQLRVWYELSLILLESRRTNEAIVLANRLFGTAGNGFDGQRYIREIEISIKEDRVNPQSSS